MPRTKQDEVSELLSLLDNAPAFTYTQKEEDFVNSMRERSEKYGAAMYVSDPQLFWLRDLKGKYVDGIAPAPRGPARRRISDHELGRRIAQKPTDPHTSAYPAAYDEDDIPF